MRLLGCQRLVPLFFVLASVGFFAFSASALATPPRPEGDEVVLGPETDLLGTDMVEDVRPAGRNTLIYLDADAPRLRKGESIVMPKSGDAPKGVFGVITRSKHLPDDRTVIETHPEPLSAAYTEYQLDLEGKTLDQLQKSEATSSGLLDELTQALHCEGSGEASAKTVARLGKLIPKVKIDVRRKEFRFELRGKPEVGGEFEAHGDETCEPRHLKRISIPLPAHGVPLFLTIAPAAKAEVDGDFKSSFFWGPELVVGAERTGGREAQPFHSLVFEKPEEPKVEGAGHVGVDLGVEVGLSLAGRIGVTGTIGPRIDADFNLSPPSLCHSATGSGYLELTGRANFFVRRWKFRIKRTNFGSKQFWRKGICEENK